jgi:hypothetical protein
MERADGTLKGSGQTDATLRGVRRKDVTLKGSVKQTGSRVKSKKSRRSETRLTSSEKDDLHLIRRISAHIVVRLRAGTLAEDDIDRAIDEALAVAP